MVKILKPANEDEVCDAVAAALADGAALEVAGNGSRRGWGHQVEAARVLDLSGLDGITLYEPDELVLRAGAGTKLAEIADALAGNDQMLGFEPADYGPLLGGAENAATIGGVLACNLSGPRRVHAGAARDHFLGFRAVNGRGEAVKSGGRVVKNVTGYDMPKLLAGSFGTLAALTEVTVKVLPAPEKTRTVLVLGLDDRAAGAAMTRALGSAHEVSGAAHLPAPLAAGSGVSYVKQAGGAVTALRLEGTAASVEYRCAALRKELSDLGETEELHGMSSGAFWAEVRDVAPFVTQPEQPVWRISVPPAAGPAVAAALVDGTEDRHFYDWGGGLLWLAPPPAADAGHDRIRAALSESGGHATLIRAPEATRAAVPVFQPQEPDKAALTARIKEGFDPHRVLNPGRMYAGV